jgi:hypothetical protein
MECGATPKKNKRTKFANAGTQKDIQLTWMGSPIFPERHTLDPETLSLIKLAPPKEHFKPTAPHGKPRRGPGRPKKAEEAEIAALWKNPKKGTGMGKRPTLHLAPSPRGGQVSVPRGPAVPARSGRPKKAKVGRPKGSKNKPKIEIETDAG